MSNVNATSAAVTGRPSCQCARGSRWNTRVSGSSHSHRSASCGWKSSSPTVFSESPRSELQEELPRDVLGVLLLRHGRKQEVRLARRGEHQRAAVLAGAPRSEEHTSELQSQSNLVCRLLLEKKNQTRTLPFGSSVAVRPYRPVL